MAIVFKTPKSTLNTTSKQIQNLGGDCPPCPEPVLEGKELNYTQNGEYTVTPEQGVDGFSSIDVTVNVPSDVNNQNKTVSPSTSSQTVEADSGYSGLGTVTVDAVTSAIDQNIAAGNIKKDVTILGVTGSYDPQPNLSNLNITPSTNAQEYNPAISGVDGYSLVSVSAVTSAIDQNIAAGNIKSGVSILGVTGNYDPQPALASANIVPATSAQTITPPAGIDGYSRINVTAVTSSIDQNIAAGNIKDGVTILGVTGNYSGSAINNQNKTVSPSTSQQSVSADQGYTGLGTVTVNAVTSSIDQNIAAGNIKNGVSILGVTGTYNPIPDLQAKTVNPSTSQQTVTPDQGKDGLSSVTVNAVTAAIDANIQAENILDGVTILGVTGTDMGYDAGYSDGYAQGQAECPEPGGCDNTAYVQETITTNGTYTYDPSDYQGDSYDAFDGVEITVNVPSSGCVDWASMGWNCQDVIDCRIAADVAYTASVKDNNNWNNDYTLVFAPKQSNGSGGVFQSCSQLAFVPDFTFTGTNVSFRNTFSMCPALESVGSISCPNVTSSRDADSMFQNCNRLTYIKNIDMKNCRRGGGMFSGCWALKDVSFTNMEQMEDIGTLLQNTAYITTIRSMSGLGKGFVDISSSPTYSGTEHTLDLSAQQYGLTKQSIMTVINDIVAPDDTNVNDATLKLSAASYALLDASDIAIATAKNWSVISA